MSKEAGEIPNHRNPDYKGEELPDELANGPVENRRCTDVFCCLIFIAFLIAWLICGFYGFSHGNPSLLTHPFDSDDNQCGLGDAADYPYLYYPFPMSEAIDYRICLKSCPNSGDNTTQCLPNSNITDCKMYWGEIMANTGYLSEYLATSQGIYESNGYLKRFCLPSGPLSLITTAGQEVNKTSSELYDSVTSDINIDILSEWVGDAWTCWEVMFIVAAFTIIIASIYLLLMRYFIGVMVWLAIVLTFAALLLLAIFLQWSGVNQYPNDPTTQKTLKILGYIMYAVSGLFLIFILFMCNRIRLAIAIMKAAVGFIADVPLSLLIPPAFLVITIIIYIYWTLAIIYLWSFGDVENRGVNPIPKIVWANTTRNAIYYEFFGVLWVNGFVIAVEEFILASAVCIWYFSANSDSGPQRPISRSVWWALCYHLGSMAFGSFILAIVWTIKCILLYITKKFKTYSGIGKNCCIRWLIGCMMCYVDCFERFIKFLNKNAYIQVALHSTSFCVSAREAFYLILRNAGRFLALGSIGYVFQMLGKGVISISATYFGYLIITHPSKWNDEIHSPVFPTIVFLLISFLIAEVFMSVYGMACDTILQCYLCDEEICRRNGRGAIHAPEILKDFVESEKKNGDEAKKGCCCC